MTETAGSAGRPSDAGRRTKVAVLGGGCGGLSAAWALTATPALRERFDVTVYERSWQLGGKGASGRSPQRGVDGRWGYRIHEHGLHIWFGFYAHAFRMLRGAYAEAGLAGGADWWQVAFERCDTVSLYEQLPDDTWTQHRVRFPRRGGADAGPAVEPRRLALARVLARTIRILANGLRADVGAPGARRGAEQLDPAEGSAVVSAAATLEMIAGQLEPLEDTVVLGTDEPLAARVRGRPHVLATVRPPAWNVAVERLIGELSHQVAELRDQLDQRRSPERARFWRGVLELVAASLAGIVSDDVLWRGLRAVDEEDLREWLIRHGASEETVQRSPVLRGLYDLTFAYRGGDKRRPSLAAGKGLQSLLMMLSYEGSFMWRMRAGMGDVVFSPLYLALRQRGVKFEFFAEVTQLRLSPGRPVIGAIDLRRTATVRAGRDAYEPVERLGEWWCWPDGADSSQLRDTSPRAETLTRDVDFDEVVLAIPVGALGPICGELTEASARFATMIGRAETVRTQGLQLWLTKSIDELRGNGIPEGLDPPATAFAEPFDTYCDMSHLLEAEGLDGQRGPRALAYFCAVLPDALAAPEAERSVRDGAIDHLERNLPHIWPDAFSHGRFNWEVLFDPQGRAGRGRFDAQYVRANMAGTDRYVTTPAGSVDARLGPDESGFDNLVLAGDWTHNGIDGGCVEAAVISGERAAEALVGRRPIAAHVRRGMGRYVDYGALATAPGPLVCERARLYCFLLRTDHAAVQRLCDRVLKEPTGGARRYAVSRRVPVVLSVGTIAGLRSLHPDHANRGSASEPEAAIWVPTIAQRFEDGRYVDEHLAIFMPYLWVDDPIAFASGREVYGFAKTQGWMRRLDDPRDDSAPALPDPPELLTVDVYGASAYGDGAEVGRCRLLTIDRRPTRRGGGPGPQPPALREGDDLSSLGAFIASELAPDAESAFTGPARRSAGSLRRPLAAAAARGATLAALVRDQAVRHVFLKQVRDAEHGELAALQQIVEARSTVIPGSMRWRRLRGTYDITIEQLASHPLRDELGLSPDHAARLAFVAEFGFRMEAGLVRWPDP